MRYSEYFEQMITFRALERAFQFYTSSDSYVDIRSSMSKLFRSKPKDYRLDSKYTEKNEDGISTVDLVCLCCGVCTPELVIYLWENVDSFNMDSELESIKKLDSLKKGYDYASELKELSLYWFEYATEFNKKPSLMQLARMYAVTIEAYKQGELHKDKEYKFSRMSLDSAIAFCVQKTLLVSTVLELGTKLTKPTTIKLNLKSNIGTLNKLDTEKAYYENLLKESSSTN